MFDANLTKNWQALGVVAWTLLKFKSSSCNRPLLRFNENLRHCVEAVHKLRNISTYPPSTAAHKDKLDSSTKCQ